MWTFTVILNLLKVKVDRLSAFRVDIFRSETNPSQCCFVSLNNMTYKFFLAHASRRM